ncbi:MAG: outer membrane beta-barrel protein [Gammaproteobacteria bacterium]|nr:outer membrane beta-barrel protein [Gammaproteobacteria bacterium]
MKRILLSLTLSMTFGAVSAQAGDLSSNSPGVYIGVTAIQGKLAVDNFTQYTARETVNKAAYPINNTLTHNTTHGGGLSVGYQDCDIRNSVLRSLQVKRISYGLEVDKTTSNIQGNVDYMRNLATLHANYDSNALFATAKVNVFQMWHFSPYLEAGVGFMRQSLNNYQADYDTGAVTIPNATNNGVAYQAGLGLDVLITQHIDASVGYRYIHAKPLVLSNQTSVETLENSPSVNTDQSQWLASLAYIF